MNHARKLLLAPFARRIEEEGKEIRIRLVVHKEGLQMANETTGGKEDIGKQYIISVRKESVDNKGIKKAFRDAKHLLESSGTSMSRTRHGMCIAS